MHEAGNNDKIKFYIGDVRDLNSLEEVVAEWFSLSRRRHMHFLAKIQRMDSCAWVHVSENQRLKI